MSNSVSYESWQRNNDQYLGAALHWLKFRLIWAAQQDEDQATPPSQPALGLIKKVTTAEIEQAYDAMRQADESNPPPALVILAHLFNLTPFEQETLLLCAAMELDTGIPGLCARVQNDPSLAYPTFALAMRLFDAPHWDIQSSESPLRYLLLIEVDQSGGRPLISSSLRLDQRIVNYIKGLNSLDERLASLLAPFDRPAARLEMLPAWQAEIAQAVLDQLRDTDRGSLPLILQLAGPDSSAKQVIAQTALAEAGLQPVRLPAASLPAQPVELGLLARLWKRESLLSPIALYLDLHVRGFLSPDAQAAALYGFLSRQPGLVLLAAPEPVDGPDSIVLNVAEPGLAASKPAAAEESTPAGPSGAGLPTGLLQPLRQTLLSCDEFQSQRQLRSLFDDARLAPFRASLPEAVSPSERIDLTVSYLMGKRITGGENALVSLLRQLSARRDPQDELHGRLARLAEQLDAPARP